MESTENPLKGGKKSPTSGIENYVPFHLAVRLIKLNHTVRKKSKQMYQHKICVLV